VSIYADPISASAHWAGPGNLLAETDRGVTTVVAGDSKYHVIRLTSQDAGAPNGTIVRIYVDENPVPKIELFNSPGSNQGLGIGAIGFGTASTAGQQEIYFDCVYGTNAGAFAPGQELACLGESLVCVPNCNRPFADADPAPGGDGDVDMNDYGLFQRCYTGSFFQGTLPPECKCFDRVSTGPSAGSIDVADFLKFTACQSGDHVPWTPTSDCP